MRCCHPPIFLLSFWQMAVYFGQFLSKRKTRSSASSDESTLLLEIKKPKPYSSPTHHRDKIMTAINMTQDVGATLQTILAKLEKFDLIESAMRKIETNLENLEKRIQRQEDFQQQQKRKILMIQKKGSTLLDNNSTIRQKLWRWRINSKKLNWQS